MFVCTYSLFIFKFKKVYFHFTFRYYLSREAVVVLLDYNPVLSSGGGGRRQEELPLQALLAQPGARAARQPPAGPVLSHGPAAGRRPLAGCTAQVGGHRCKDGMSQITFDAVHSAGGNEQAGRSRGCMALDQLVAQHVEVTASV
jgi:hypothetical protein